MVEKIKIKNSFIYIATNECSGATYLVVIDKKYNLSQSFVLKNRLQLKKICI